MHVVLVIGSAVSCLSNQRNRRRPRMKGIRGRSIILKWIHNRRVIQRCLPGDPRCIASAAACSAIDVCYRSIEAFMEEAPGHACVVQQIANVLTFHMDESAG